MGKAKTKESTIRKLEKQIQKIETDYKPKKP